MIYPKVSQKREQVAEHYNALDDCYRKIWGEHLHHGYWKGNESAETAVKQLSELVADSAQIKQGDRVCDIGCGYGGTSELLARQFGAEVTGLTISKAQLKIAKQRSSQSNPTYLLCDWLENNLSNATFDAVISIESSEHMVDKQKFFNEAHRVLRPNGRIVVCAWLAKEKPTSYEERYLLEPICREGRLPSMGSIQDYHLWMEKAGFQDIQYTDLTRQVRKTWAICMRRSLKACFTDPAFRALFLSRNPERIFAKSLLRIWVAYYLGSMRYGLFTAASEKFA